MSFLAIDGDNVGQAFERMVLEHRTADITSYAKAVRSRIEGLRDMIEAEACDVIVADGDTIIAEIPGEIPRDLLAQLSLDVPVSFSCGIGATLREAWMALRYAKTLKPGAVFKFDGAFHRVQPH